MPKWRKLYEGAVNALSHLNLVADVLFVIPGLKGWAIAAKALDALFDWERARLAHSRAQEKLNEKGAKHGRK